MSNIMSKVLLENVPRDVQRKSCIGPGCVRGIVKGFDQWFVQRSVQEVSMGTFAELSKDVSKGILKVKFEIDHI